MPILNYPCLPAVLVLCGLACLTGLPVNIGNPSLISFALAQPTALTKSQSDALNAYNKTMQEFRSILSERRAQINANQKLPDLTGTGISILPAST